MWFYIPLTEGNVHILGVYSLDSQDMVPVEQALVIITRFLHQKLVLQPHLFEAGPLLRSSSESRTMPLSHQ